MLKSIEKLVADQIYVINKFAEMNNICLNFSLFITPADENL